MPRRPRRTACGSTSRRWLCAASPWTWSGPRRPLGRTRRLRPPHPARLPRTGGPGPWPGAQTAPPRAGRRHPDRCGGWRRPPRPPGPSPAAGGRRHGEPTRGCGCIR
ncbi:hypothetical protein ACFFX0_32535 [Citricoccus parietis]|uniref:Uncharacterized protein n=1 Tax=Citricoccus parietis TaxID=592307 RepID=A0ABV5G9Q5_9MICC